MRTYRIGVLGPFTAVGPSGPIELRPAQRRLLSILLIDRKRASSRETIIDRMWSDGPPQSARNALQVHVAGIRKAMPDLIDTTQNGYALNGRVLDCDIDRFVAMVDRSKADSADGNWHIAIESCNEALGLWRGRPHQELSHAEFAHPEQARLSELHEELLERRSGALLALGQIETALPELEQLVELYPLRERFWEHLMLARYRMGRQAEALRAYRKVATILGEELGIEPGPRLRGLEEEILVRSRDLDHGPPINSPHNLPRPTSTFFERDDDVERVSQLLEAERIVTIIGWPGVGKTRLAIEVARSQLHRYPGGVWLVDVVGARDASDLSASIAAATGAIENVSRLTDLARALADRPALIVLDNCDHVEDEVRLFMRACLNTRGVVRILATSRNVVGVSMSGTWRANTLPVPETADLDHARTAVAMRLLVDRIRSVSPDFVLDESNVVSMVELCRRTDGIPLAIELAARSIPAFGAEHAVVIDRTAFSDPVRTSVDWTFQLVAESDRQHLIAASVFAGAIPFDALYEVCAPNVTQIEMTGIVARLVESALLRAAPTSHGHMRYSMLEPVREFCRTHLAAPDREAVTARHRAWFAARAHSLSTVSREEVEPSMPDFRASLRSLLDHGEADDAATIATGLLQYWNSTYLTWEASRWLDEILGHELTDEQRMQMFWEAGWVAYHNHDYASAHAHYAACQRLAEELDSPLFVARSLYGVGRIIGPIDPEHSERLLERALDSFRQLSDARAEEAACWMALGIGRAWRGHTGSARRSLWEALSLIEGDPSSGMQAVCHRYLSLCALSDGDEAGARESVSRAISVAVDGGDDRAHAGAQIQRALVEATWGDINRAAEAMLIALDPVPESAEIDLALVSFGAVPIMISAGHAELADEILVRIDGVFDRYGWMPIAERSPLAASYRSQVTMSEPHRERAQYRDRLTRTLRDVSRR